MKLLILTQKIDKNDPILGFFHRWLEEFSKCFEKVTVICLERGESTLPTNVRVFSLGKEGGKSRVRYILRFYQYIWQERKNYDAVFIHMNQEYVLLGWKFWKLWGKTIYLWRNHAKGNFLTRLAVLFSDKVFYTSPKSYTAQFKKAVQMPVGIDTEFFKPDQSVSRIPKSILFLGRIAPVKRVLEFIDWLKGRNFDLVTIAGSALPKDKDYENEVRIKVEKSDFRNKVKFIGTVTQEEARKLYQTHETYVNFTPSGSMDKTILEATTCETSIIVMNENLKYILENKKGPELRDFVVKNHSLKVLMNQLINQLCLHQK